MDQFQIIWLILGVVMSASTVYALAAVIKNRSAVDHIVKEPPRVGSVVFASLSVPVSAALQVWSIVFIDSFIRKDFVRNFAATSIFLPTMLVFACIMAWFDFEHPLSIKMRVAKKGTVGTEDAALLAAANDPRRLLAMPGIIGMYMFAPLLPAVIKLIVAVRRLSKR